MIEFDKKLWETIEIWFAYVLGAALVILFGAALETCNENLAWPIWSALLLLQCGLGFIHLVKGKIFICPFSKMHAEGENDRLAS